MNVITFERAIADGITAQSLVDVAARNETWRTPRHFEQAVELRRVAEQLAAHHGQPMPAPRRSAPRAGNDNRRVRYGERRAV
jgi:hypothetical protein